MINKDKLDIIKNEFLEELFPLFLEIQSNVPHKLIIADVELHPSLGLISILAQDLWDIEFKLNYEKTNLKHKESLNMMALNSFKKWLKDLDAFQKENLQAFVIFIKELKEVLINKIQKTDSIECQKILDRRRDNLVKKQYKDVSSFF